MMEGNEPLKREIEEYKKRHPFTEGTKNEEAYFVLEEQPQKEQSSRNPGVQLGYRGHFRRTPKILK